jgi:DNA-binding NarL/FixJ family response regulator
MIRIATLDHQPLIGLAVETLLRAEPGLAPVGAVADAGDLWPLLYRTDPDVVLLDGSIASLVVCLRIKRRALAPRVVLYAAPEPGFAVAAALAGADRAADRSSGAWSRRGALPSPGRGSAAARTAGTARRRTS